MPSACNVPGRTIFTGDNLDILRGINSECVDLIYLDPPFNSNRTYAAPLDSEARGAEFRRPHGRRIIRHGLPRMRARVPDPQGTALGSIYSVPASAGHRTEVNHVNSE